MKSIMIFNLVVALGLMAGAWAQAPVNDQCIYRIKLEPDEPVYGNVTEANFDYHNQGVCGPRSDRAGVWYEVRGEGVQVTVKVCTNNEVITDFGVFLECNSQKCQGAPSQTFEPANCDEQEYVSYNWTAERDVQYFVHVRSDVLDGVGSNFTIVYEPTKPPPKASSAQQNYFGPAVLITMIFSLVACLW